MTSTSTSPTTIKTYPGCNIGNSTQSSPGQSRDNALSEINKSPAVEKQMKDKVEKQMKDKVEKQMEDKVEKQMEDKVEKQMEDTVALARLEREKQGPWEVEVSYGGEGDLHKHLKGCDKNPGHQKFVPVDQFNVDHLPPGCHDSDLVHLVRAVSDLTVRVSVKYVSDRRPETVRGKPYPSYKDRGGNMMRVGTGWVCSVVMNQDEDNLFNMSCQYQECVNSSTSRICQYQEYVNSSTSVICQCQEYVNSSTTRICQCQEYVNSSTTRICQCQECVNSSTPKNQFAYIYINTAAHVVFDDLEAAHTTCHLFFDKGGTPDACSDVVILTGLSVVKRDLNHDFCKFRCVTHDLDVAKFLDQILKCFNGLQKCLCDKYDRTKQKLLTPTEKLPDTIDKLAIIVSHPHGCSKQVSVGQYTDMVEMGFHLIPSSYTTPTCPGTSGAHVIVLKGGRLLYMKENLVHIGQHKGNTNLNFSSNYLFLNLELFM